MSTPGLRQERYGARRRRPHPVLLAGVAVLAAAFLGWLAWAAWFHATPAATSELVGYDVIDDNSAIGIVDVALSGDVDPADVTCLLRATAYDHTTVGEQPFTPAEGRAEYSVRTERKATSVALVGCTAPGQPRPR